MDELLFTPAALLGILAGIEELKDVDVGITETIDGQIQLTVGESNYLIDTENATVVPVEPAVVETVSDANQSAYDELEAAGEVELETPVSAGVLKEIARSLLLGGMIRLSAKILKS